MLLTPLTTVAALLVLAGTGKLSGPETSASALAHAGLAVRAFPIRLLGSLEVGLGLTAIFAPSRVIAVAIAAVYTGFAVVTLRLLRAGGRGGCGCFGARSAPAHPVHLALNLVACAVATAAAAAPVAADLPGVVLSHPVAGGLLAASAAAATALAHRAYVAVPALWDAWKAPGAYEPTS